MVTKVTDDFIDQLKSIAESDINDNELKMILSKLSFVQRMQLMDKVSPYRLRQVKLYCRVCDEDCEIEAAPIRVHAGGIPICIDIEAKTPYVALDWDNADIECSFVYRCSQCGARVADSLMDIEAQLAAGNSTKTTNEELGILGS